MRRRSSAGSRERGATLFVVVLAITMLTGVGLYTVHASSLAARAAGNGRQASQADRVAELNALAFLSALRVEPRPYIQEAVNANPGQCEMNGSLTAGTTCLQLTSDGLVPASGAPLIGTDSLGSLGTLSGKARLEITDVNDLQIPIPGHDLNKEEIRYYQATVTVIASLNPGGVPANACVGGMMQVAGQRIVRSQLIIGPMPKVWKQAKF
ncbi:MAG TPA: pilus assembly PilX N-terminal domain-containing protein [Polyangiaceae bacterium]